MCFSMKQLIGFLTDIFFVVKIVVQCMQGSQREMSNCSPGNVIRSGKITLFISPLCTQVRVPLFPSLLLARRTELLPVSFLYL